MTFQSFFSIVFTLNILASGLFQYHTEIIIIHIAEIVVPVIDQIFSAGHLTQYKRNQKGLALGYGNSHGIWESII